MNLGRYLFLAGGLLALSASFGSAAEPPDKKEPSEVSYYKDVRRIFQQHCQGCHQPAKPQGGYVMTSFADLLKKGDHEQAGVVPGHPEQSMIVEQILPQAGKKPAMPKGKDPLPAPDVEIIKKWIAAGAKNDTPKTQEHVIDAGHPPVYTVSPDLSCVTYSPDGSLLAVSGYHEVLLHKGDGSGLAGRLVGLSERIESIAFSPDGKSLAVAGGSPGRFGEIQVWDVAKRKLKLSVPITFDTVYGVSWSHDGSKLAFGAADNTVRAIDSTTGKQVLFQGAHSDWVLGTVFSKDSTYLVSISRDRSMKLTEVATQRFIDNVTSITPGVLKGGLLAVARNPKKSDVKVKNTAVGTDQTEKFYDELLIGGDDGVPRLYKMHRTTKRVIGDDANKVREYAKMPGLVYALAFSADGSLFAAGSSLDGKGELRVYQTADGKVVSKLEGIGPIYSVSFRPDGTQVASAGFDGVVRLSDAKTGKVVKEFVPVPLVKTAQAR
ncbi:MAG TPA: c-type cytochrome domain-containing protein [Gemmataceae bacterium]|nr:c-type cytochrome domain-containing protein [Gemmataceae bacterium]